jgi:secretion/DNA translocation related TadE-like protein
MTSSARPDASAGSGSLLGIAICGGIAVTLSLLAPLFVGLMLRASIGGTADAAALAAADVAAGISPGTPCVDAASVATANGATLTACQVDGLVVTVAVGTSFWGIPLGASATAGPPGLVTN